MRYVNRTKLTNNLNYDVTFNTCVIMKTIS